ncbi:hypothetical protein [Streptomyces silvensis]|uniref:Uncharacterized protein n=1 Tax=Streptomyces silvensis TaxID=1765722 RepID=A0A0W7X9F8_9ACTN|nr:hypothetical protein [Streptomyces silvensis]KUF19596.1 hypothetical protein AT728_04285 [Streptomyces silvensis]
MIRPSTVHVSATRTSGPPGDLWLHFDMTQLVALPVELARCLTYQLAPRVGLVVVPLPNASETDK